MKGYSDHKLFICEDLPPEAHISGRAPSALHPSSPGDFGISEPASNSLSTSKSVDSSNVRSSSVGSEAQHVSIIALTISVAITAKDGDLALITLRI